MICPCDYCKFKSICNFLGICIKPKRFSKWEQSLEFEGTKWRD